MDLKLSFERFKNFLRECARVFRITKKPTKEEFRTIVKASSIGMAIIGFIGFIIVLIKQLLFN